MTRKYTHISRMSDDEIAEIKALTADHTLTTAAKKLGIKYAQLQYICNKFEIQFKKYGAVHPTAKLSDHDVWLIRELYKEGVTQREIAKKMEVSHGYVSHLVRGRFRVCQTTAN